MAKEQKEKTEKLTTKLTTCEFRSSFPNVFVPKENDLSGKKEFIIDALIAKTSGCDEPDQDPKLKPFMKIIQNAMKNAGLSAKPKKWRSPIKDGDDPEKNYPNDYADHWLMTFKCGEDYPPTVITTRKGADGKFQSITNKKDFYGGCYARASINAYWYEIKHPKTGAIINCGVSFGLMNLQKTKEGERFGGQAESAEDSFADTEELYGSTDDQDAEAAEEMPNW